MSGLIGNSSKLQHTSIRLKSSPPSSPVTTPLIKYERATSIDDTEGNFVGMSSLGMGAQTGSLPVGITGDNSVTLPVESTDDDQPCDLRLSSFRMNLVSMALQQAAAAVISGGTVTNPAGMQQATLQTMAATPPTHLSSLINFSHPHAPPHTQLTTQSSSITPTRRYSTSTSSVAPPSGVGVGVGVGPTNRVTSPMSGKTNTLPSIQSSSSSIASSGPSTSAAAAAAAANSTLVPGGGSSCSDETITTGTGAIGNSGSGTAGSGHITPISTGSGGSFGGAYSCERCGNSYARPHSLNRHMRFECGVEPKFECPICHKKSKHKHNLVLHMRTHQHR